MLITLCPLPAGFVAVTVFAHATNSIPEMKILDLQQAARLLQMNPESLRRLAFRGAIPARKPGWKWLFVERHLEEWLSYLPDSIDEIRRRLFNNPSAELIEL